MEFVLAGSEEDVRIIEELSNTIWNEHYTPIIGTEQVQYMLGKFLSRDIIKEQIDNQGYQYYFMKLDNEILGFLAFFEKDGLFLSKLYLLKAHRGKGYSKLAISMLKNVCKEKGLHRIWLQVDRKNTNSIKAYKALGFEKLFEKATDIGEGYVMDDYFLELKLV